jgi:putative FmdB family regulatory protein
MPTYEYEVIDSAERFEVRQSFNDAPLTKHPKTGVPVRRVISGGMALIATGNGESESPGPGCGPGSCGCGKFS